MEAREGDCNLSLKKQLLLVSPVTIGSFAVSVPSTIKM